MTKGSLSGKVLLLDDLVDSGVTLEKVQRHLKDNFPAVAEVKSAVIWCKLCSSIRPDFYLNSLDSSAIRRIRQLAPTSARSMGEKGRSEHQQIGIRAGVCASLNSHKILVEILKNIRFLADIEYVITERIFLK